MLRLDHLTLTYPGFHLAANWSADPAQIIALIGPSGAGKSTLLLTIAGFLPQVGGKILWRDQSLTDLPPADRPISILFQDQNLFPHLTLKQNLGLALSPDLRLTPEHQNQIDAVLDRLGLQGFGARRPADLSGGQQARAALGRVLLQNRPILLLDEPFAALGPALKTDLLALVQDHVSQTGALVLMVTHDPRDAQRFASQTVLVAQGLAAPPVRTDGLFANPSLALRDYLGS